MRRLYSAVFYVLVPFIILRWLLKSIKEPAFRQHLWQRFGYYARGKQACELWFHAVSFGEIEVARPLVTRALKEGLSVLITTTTASGMVRAKQYFGDSAIILYSPLDIPFAIKRLLTHFSPKKCVIIETEIWPNWFYHIPKQDCQLMIANARLSERSFKGYLKIRRLMAPALQRVNKLLAQTIADKKRFVALGVIEQKASVMGNLKYDIRPQQPEPVEFKRLQQAAQGRFVLLAASTHPGEEEILLQAYQKIKTKIPNCLLIIAPRHPRRSHEIASLIKKSQLSLALRSHNDAISNALDVFMLDTLGELSLFYPLCDVCFVGGSLVQHGGHNVLEPIGVEKPVITGPHTFNFKKICEELVEAKAIAVVSDADTTSTTVIKLFNDSGWQQQLVSNANRVYQRNQGSLERQWLAISTC